MGGLFLGEDPAEVRLVLDGSLEVRLHVDTLGGLLRGRLDRRGIQLLAGAARLHALGAHGLRAGAGESDRRLRAGALAVERDRRGNADDGEARGRMRISSSPTAVAINPLNQSSTFTVRRPLAPSQTISAPSAIIAAG